MSETEIAGFQGEYRFLSNFWHCPLKLQGYVFPTAEHAYQAAKCAREEEFQRILRAPSPSAAKRMGRKVQLVTGWPAIQVEVMRAVIEAKFRNPVLRLRLLATGDKELIEANTWGDTFWGVCRGKGSNQLGRILMAERDSIKIEIGA